MLPLSQPVLFSNGMSSYDCPDIRTLYHWLAVHDYRFVGCFGPKQYGRFACDPLSRGENGPDHVSSSIEVYLNGVVIAADERAQQMLEQLVSTRYC